MGISARAGGEPDGNDEAAVFELDAVIRAGGQHLPFVVLFEGVKGGGDLHGLAPCEAVVRAALVEAALILQAEEHVHGAVLVGDEDGVVVGHIVGIDVLHLECEGVFDLGSFDIGNALRLAPYFALVCAAAEQDANVVPVADTGGTFACFAPGEHGALGRDHDAGDVVELVGGIVPHDEEVLFFDEG